VGNSPFLRPINNKMLPILTPDSRRLNIANIAARTWFCNRNANSLLPSNDIRYKSLLQFMTSKLQNWRKTKCYSCGDGARGSKGTGSCHFVNIDEGVQVVKFFDRQTTGEVRDADFVEPFYWEGCTEVGN
jgi:hypothetical protein